MMLGMSVSTLFAQESEKKEYPKGPDLEFVCELNVRCDGTYRVGKTPHGTRQVIPIVGGTFEGPGIKGEVLPGGADYQMQCEGHTEIEAIYSIKTDDGVNIHIRNCGIIKGNYFRTSPKFEAPIGSKYEWLNDGIFVCMPGQGKPGAGGAGPGFTICLRVWKVK